MSKQIVEQVKAALVARGQRWQTNEDAFQITGRVAWILRGQGAMLISKSGSQNGAVISEFRKVSHDAIAFPTGWIDCLHSAGPNNNANEPAWDHTNSSNAALIAPWDMDLGALPEVLTPPVVTEPTQPAPVAASSIEVRLTAIENALVELAKGFKLLAIAATTDPTYDVPYDITAPWPIGHQKGSFVMTPRKR